MSAVSLNNSKLCAYVSQSRSSISKHFWNIDKFGNVVRPSTFVRHRFTVSQVSRDEKFTYMDQQIMSEILGRPVIENIIHKDGNFLNCEDENMDLQQIPAMSLVLKGGKWAHMSKCDLHVHPYCSDLTSSEWTVGGLHDLAHYILDGVTKRPDKYQLRDGNICNLERHNLIPTNEAVCVDLKDRRVHVLSEHEHLLAPFKEQNAASTPAQKVMQYILGYWVDFREIEYMDGDQNNLRPLNLRIKTDRESVRTRLMHRWRANSVIRLAHDMYRVTENQCWCRGDSCDGCFGKNCMQQLDRLISETRIEYGDIHGRCHSRCRGICWKTSNAGCYGNTHIYEKVSQRIADTEFIQDQLLPFLLFDLAEITLHYLPPHTAKNLSWGNVSDLCEREDYRMTPLEYNEMKDENLRAFYDLCIASQYTAHDNDLYYLEWYESRRASGEIQKKVEIVDDGVRMYLEALEEIEDAWDVTKEEFDVIIKKKHGHVPTSKYPQLVHLIVTWFRSLNHRHATSKLITDAIEVITGCKL
jgi:hypothetical protein